MNSMKAKEIDFSRQYEGYIWWSNRNSPEEFHGDRLLEASAFETRNPFIVEGWLYDKEKGVSYGIKFVDGEYMIHRFEVSKEDFCSEDVERKVFYTNRMESSRMEFLRYWKEKRDERCLGMPVLVMDKMVFVGFKED